MEVTTNMSSLQVCIDSISPLLILVLFGYGIKRVGFIPKDGFKHIDKLCFKLFIPIMLFCNIYSADFSKGLDWRIILYAAGGYLLVFAAVFLLLPFCSKNADNNATLVHGLCHGNVAALGIPLIVLICAEQDTGLFSIMLAFTSPFVNALMVFEHEYFRGGKYVYYNY